MKRFINGKRGACNKQARCTVGFAGVDRGDPGCSLLLRCSESKGQRREMATFGGHKDQGNQTPKIMCGFTYLSIVAFPFAARQQQDTNHLIYSWKPLRKIPESALPILVGHGPQCPLVSRGSGHLKGLLKVT